VLLLNQCYLEINTLLQLQRDMVQYLYPNSKQPDKFIYFPIYGVDKTTNEGMLLTGVKLNQLAGLLVKSDRGRYTPGPNAKTRKLFLYGDGLLVVAHNKLHDTIYQQRLRLGNERYVKTLFVRPTSTYGAIRIAHSLVRSKLHQNQACNQNCSLAGVIKIAPKASVRAELHTPRCCTKSVKPTSMYVPNDEKDSHQSHETL
jgi:hypothetical protein